MDVNTLLFTLPKWRGMSVRPFGLRISNLPVGDLFSNENKVVESADKMTKRQIAAKVRTFFKPHL